MDTELIKREIETFVVFFKRQIEVVNALSCLPDEMVAVTAHEDVTLHKKIVYVSLLDCFASLRFHEAAHGQLARHNKKRFTLFLKECADWNVGGLTSLVFLDDWLQEASPGGRLAQYVTEKLTILGNDFGDTVSAIDVDEEPETLFKFSSTEAEKEAILHCQHYSIMYRYRNNLVHQARRPGGACEMLGENQSEACYHTYAGNPAIYLLYPIALFKKLCTSSLENVDHYLQENNLDPYGVEVDPRCF